MSSVLLDPRLTPLTRSDLQFSYPPGTTVGDNPRVRGVPDSALLNRDEWYEMLYFCNRFAINFSKERDSVGMAQVAKRAERLIKKQVPDYLRSQVHITDWLSKNWNFYPKI